MFRAMKERVGRRRAERHAAKPHCRRRKHKWQSRGRGDALTYVCQLCGETSDKPPRRKWGASEAPYHKGPGF